MNSVGDRSHLRAGIVPGGGASHVVLEFAELIGGMVDGERGDQGSVELPVALATRIVTVGANGSEDLVECVGVESGIGAKSQ